MNSQKNVLVTGASGFIGTHLLRALIADASVGRIHVIDLKAPLISSDKIRYWRADIRMPIDLELGRECDVCYHLAALCKDPGYEWSEYFKTNQSGTRNVVALAEREGIQRIIYTSTIMVFRPGDERMTEESCTSPDTAYGISKLLGEYELRYWQARDESRRLRIVRPGVVFGEGENGNFTRLYNALKKHRFAFVGRSETVKSCVYVKDVVRALRFVETGESACDVYNVVVPEAPTIQQICSAFQNVFRLGNFRIPVVPYRLALAAGYAGELLRLAGVRVGLHHRQAEKLYQSTNVSSQRIVGAGFRFEYDVRHGLSDWAVDCQPGELR